MEQSNVLLEEEIKEYKPMVLGIAKQYWQNYNNGKEIHIEFNDIVQEGFIGLIKANESYLDKYGSKKAWCGIKVRHHIQDYFRNCDFIPRAIREKITKLRKKRDFFYSRYGRQPSEEELCDLLNITMEQYLSEYANIMECSFQSLYAENNRDNNNGEVVFECDIPMDYHEDTINGIFKKQQLGIIQSALYLLYVKKSITSKDYIVFKRYFFESKTMSCAGKSVGLTESRCSQIITNTIKKIKKIIKQIN